MTIDEAIKRLAPIAEGGRTYIGEIDKEAIGLAIEALKRVKGNRLYPQPTVYPLLPGETEK